MVKGADAPTLLKVEMPAQTPDTSATNSERHTTAYLRRLLTEGRKPKPELPDQTANILLSKTNKEANAQIWHLTSSDGQG